MELSNLSLRDLQNACYEVSVKSGWWEGLDVNNPLVFATKLALIHSEVSEAMEGNRKNLMDPHITDRRNAEVELADAIIRILDLGGAMGFDLAGAVQDKMAYNSIRPDHKPSARAEEHGKKY